MEVLSDPFDVYILGCCLFALYSRSRWSDLQHLQSMWFERYQVSDGIFGFVEARTKFHKTGSSMERKLRYMPLVAPINGVTKVDWTQLWLKAMQDVGFEHHAQPVGALCRPPLQNGSLAGRPLTSDEASGFLRRVLGVDDMDIKSRSLKHTTLAWSAKYGIGETARTILGHHEIPGRSCAVYSRDLLTRPLQRYCAMLVNIKAGKFVPDSSRATWMGLVPTGGADSAEAVAPMISDSDADDEGEEHEPESSGEEINSISSDGSSESSDESEAEAAPAQSHGITSEELDIAGPVWVNNKSKTVHKAGPSDASTACGRRIQRANFTFCEQGTTSLNPRCAYCYKHELIVSREQLSQHLEIAARKRARR